MSFADQHDDIARLCLMNGKFYRFVAVNNAMMRRGVHSRHNLVDNLLRIFIAGIVRCENDHITVLRGNFSHDRTFFLVTISATAKHGDQSIRFQILCQFKHIVNAIRRMRIIDDDGKRLPFVHQFKPAGNNNFLFQPGFDRFKVEILGNRHSNCREAIIDIEQSR